MLTSADTELTGERVGEEDLTSAGGVRYMMTKMRGELINGFRALADEARFVAYAVSDSARTLAVACEDGRITALEASKALADLRGDLAYFRGEDSYHRED